MGLGSLVGSLLTFKNVALTVFAVATYVLVGFTYRLFFHPLAKFKGPWQAAFSTHWIAGVHKRGFPEGELATVHKEYDTHVLRIAPDEVHIDDVRAYDKIYSRNADPMKVDLFYRSFLSDGNVFTLRDQDAHRARRKILSPAFSAAGTAKLEPLVQKRLDILINKITSKKVVNVADAFRCFTIDVISEFAFGESLEISEHDPDFNSFILRTFDAGFEVHHNILYSPMMVAIFTFVTQRPWIANMDKNARGFSVIREHVEKSLKRHAALTASQKDPELPRIFDLLVGNPMDALVNEALSIMVAGSDTTAYTLIVGIFHILKNPSARDRLVRELLENVPDINNFPQYNKLGQLPYLRATIQESLRIASPVVGRLPRVLQKPVIVDGMEIPAGTTVGISAYTMHNSAKLWGDDYAEFIPDRWLGKKNLDESLVAFSKGPRQCLGINLAYLELTLTFAHLFRKFDMEVVESHLEIFDSFVSVFKQRKNIVKFEKAQK